jgi:hypothetical protein
MPQTGCSWQCTAPHVVHYVGLQNPALSLQSTGPPYGTTMFVLFVLLHRPGRRPRPKEGQPNVKPHDQHSSVPCSGSGGTWESHVPCWPRLAYMGHMRQGGSKPGSVQTRWTPLVHAPVAPVAVSRPPRKCVPCCCKAWAWAAYAVTAVSLVPCPVLRGTVSHAAEER